MKILKNRILIIIFILLMILYAFISHITNKNIACAEDFSEIVMELNTNRILYGNNIDNKRYMASTTKILTAITVIENCNLDEVITITNKTVGIEGSSIYLEANEKLSVKDLLFGLMLRSGNDCAETLAIHCSNSIEEFAKLMNNTANKIGAKNSNFVNPHGLHNDNHYTTAYDLALISCYAMKNMDFREIVGTKRKVIPWTTREYDRVLINKNKMLSEFDGSTGIKTGFTKKAGRCLVSSCLRNGMELICVVLNCPPMFERSKELLTNCFSNYKLYKMYESDNIVDFIDMENSLEKCGIYCKNDIYLPLKEGEIDKVKVVLDVPKCLSSPLEKDSHIGNILFYLENNLIFSEKLYNIVSIKT